MVWCLLSGRFKCDVPVLCVAGGIVYLMSIIVLEGETARAAAGGCSHGFWLVHWLLALRADVSSHAQQFMVLFVPSLLLLGELVGVVCPFWLLQSGECLSGRLLCAGVRSWLAHLPVVLALCSDQASVVSSFCVALGC